MNFAIQHVDYWRDELSRVAPKSTEVIVALPDLYGRLVGSTVSVDHFLSYVVVRGLPACSYLLACDLDMEMVPGMELDPSGNSYGDFVLVPVPGTLRLASWETDTAIVIADVYWPNGSDVAVSPRSILNRQLERLGAVGLVAFAGTEVEFLVFDESYDEALRRRYSDLTAATRFNSDYSLTGLERIDKVTSRLRTELSRSGFEIETARGEINRGQYEVVCRYQEAMATCDAHAVLKTAAKRIAAQEGKSLTFMSRFDGGEGNACHIHFSLRTADGGLVFPAEDSDDQMSSLMKWFMAGLLVCVRDFALLSALTINSYKRLARAEFAPKLAGWGWDDRLSAVRVVGRGVGLRFEYRLPGGDANPYLAMASIVAGGLYGIENQLELPTQGDGGEVCLPRTLSEALESWESSELVREAFGPDVRRHYSQLARAELELFESTVTDWERIRGFERL
ncbi:glutamine synthetase family protein [Rhodococcus sp. NPDC060176]|uniref:glutamine synthetase family protein n=1 Tax=Rhodococcus sp. NPDC060176 TaxID=3347062 RepID=UPI00365CE437